MCQACAGLPLPLCFAGLLHPPLSENLLQELCLKEPRVAPLWTQDLACMRVSCHSPLWLGLTSAFVMSLSRSLGCAGLKAKSLFPQPRGGIAGAPETSSSPIGEELCYSHGNRPLTNQASHLSGSLVQLPGDGLFPLISCGVSSLLLPLPLEPCLLRCCATFLCTQCPCLRDPRTSLTHSQLCGALSDTVELIMAALCCNPLLEFTVAC